ncbi:plasmid pRiA4b ORF-3 family protein [Priestia koreensis]|uniref:plasmid pRiA4b ORF-3 family protein n=1 Tax=Priestia koreensis TaxID=284581 RepID=UPI0030162875
MLIQCTKKLLDELMIKSVKNEGEVNELFAWHANILTINRRKTVVFMNDLTRYCIVLYGVKKRDFQNLHTLLLEGIKKVFQSEFIADEVIQHLLQHTSEPVYAKTKDRTMVARLNKVCDTVIDCAIDSLDTNELIQVELSKGASRYLYGNGKNSYMYPHQTLFTELKEWSKKPIFEMRAVQLNVTMELDSFHIWRRLIVPENITFSALHKVLQKTFNWQNYHLHEFHVYPASDSEGVFYGPNPSLTIVCDKESLAYPAGVPMRLEHGLTLDEYLPAVFKYVYDFGDEWIHVIEIEQTLICTEQNHASCLEGEGIAPPEDVGGETGFINFLSVMKDVKHPDYGHMRHWGVMQGYQPFDLKTINYFLKRL